MALFKDGDLSVGPSMIPTLILWFDFLHALGRIVLAPFLLFRDLHHFAQHLAQTVGAIRFVGASLHHLFDVLCFESDSALVAVRLTVLVDLAAEAIDDVAVDVPGDRLSSALYVALS